MSTAECQAIGDVRNGHCQPEYIELTQLDQWSGSIRQLINS